MEVAGLTSRPLQDDRREQTSHNPHSASTWSRRGSVIVQRSQAPQVELSESAGEALAGKMHQQSAHEATATAIGGEEPRTIELDELCCLAANEMLAVALLAGRRAYPEKHAAERDATGNRLVVVNGAARPRQVLTGVGAVAVKAPRVDDRREGSG